MAREVTLVVMGDQTHNTIIIFCHRLPSNPKLLFAGGVFLTTRPLLLLTADSYSHLLCHCEQH